MVPSPGLAVIGFEQARCGVLMDGEQGDQQPGQIVDMDP
jgi:hypothetical protein